MTRNGKKETETLACQSTTTINPAHENEQIFEGNLHPSRRSQFKQKKHCHRKSWLHKEKRSSTKTNMNLTLTRSTNNINNSNAINRLHDPWSLVTWPSFLERLKKAPESDQRSRPRKFLQWFVIPLLLCFELKVLQDRVPSSLVMEFLGSLLHPLWFALLWGKFLCSDFIKRCNYPSVGYRTEIGQKTTFEQHKTSGVSNNIDIESFSNQLIWFAAFIQCVVVTQIRENSLLLSIQPLIETPRPNSPHILPSLSYWVYRLLSIPKERKTAGPFGSLAYLFFNLYISRALALLFHRPVLLSCTTS